MRSVHGLGGAGRPAGSLRAETLAVLDALAPALEAGLPVPDAVALAVDSLGAAPDPLWLELRRRARQGHGLAAAWSAAARRSGEPALAAVARTWAVGEATGAPLAEAVRCGARAAREAERLEQAIEVAAAGARATVLVLSLLPVSGVGMAALLGVPPVELYANPLALAGLGLGLLLLAGGHLVVQRLVDGVRAGVHG